VNGTAAAGLIGRPFEAERGPDGPMPVGVGVL